MPKKKMTAMQKKMYLLRQMRGRGILSNNIPFYTLRGAGGGQSKVSPVKEKEIQKEVKRIVKEEQILRKLKNNIQTVKQLNEIGYPPSLRQFAYLPPNIRK
jgi:23S rRNA A2030 N6-methylase RlmJ